MNGRDVTPTETDDLRALDDLEARLDAELLSELAVVEGLRLPTVGDAPLGRLVTVDDPGMAYAPSTSRPRPPGGLSPKYAGSEQEKRDREAEEVLAAAAAKRPAS